eukprot:scaffold109954_cov28-Tisochrysis_lutea.AAC.3
MPAARIAPATASGSASHRSASAATEFERGTMPREQRPSSSSGGKRLSVCSSSSLARRPPSSPAMWPTSGAITPNAKPHLPTSGSHTEKGARASKCRATTGSADELHPVAAWVASRARANSSKILSDLSHPLSSAP